MASTPETGPSLAQDPTGASSDIRADSESRLTGDTTTAVVAGARVVMLSQGFTITTRLVTSVLVAIMLGPKAIGVVAIAQTVMLLFDQIRDMGTGIALIQRPQLTNSIICTVFFFNVLVGLSLMLLQMAISQPVGELMRAPQAGAVLLALAPIPLILSLGQVHHALLRRDLKYREIGLLNAISAAANAVATIAGALAGLGAWALALGIAVGYCVDTALTWHFDKWRPWPSWQVEWRSMREIAGFSTHLFLANGVGFVFSQADKFLVGRWLGVASLGLYALAQRVLNYPRSAVSNVVGEVTLPAFAKHQADNSALQSGFTRSARVVALLTFPLMAGAAVVARPMVDGGMSPQWHDLAVLIWILAPLGAIQSITTLAGSLIMAKGRGGAYMWFTLLATLPVLATFAFCMRWGLAAACVGAAAMYVALTPFMLSMCFREIAMSRRKFFGDMAAVTLITVVMAAGVLGVESLLSGHVHDLTRMFVGIATGTAIYGGLMLLFRPAALKDTVEAVFRRRRQPA